MFRLLMLLIVGAAFVALHASTLEEGGSAGVSLPPNGRLAGVPGSVASATTLAITSAEKGAGVLGTAGSFVIAPAIRGIVDRNESAVTALQPAIRRASGARQQRAREIQRRITQADSVALVRLEDGHPIAAFRETMKSRSLVDAIRHQVAEEMIR